MWSTPSADQLVGTKHLDFEKPIQGPWRDCDADQNQCASSSASGRDQSPGEQVFYFGHDEVDQAAHTSAPLPVIGIHDVELERLMAGPIR